MNKHEPQIIDMYCNKNMTLKQVADTVHSHAPTIAKTLENAGIKRRRKGRPYGPDTRNTVRDANIVSMRSLGISETVIGRRYGITRQGIDNILKREGIRGRIVPLCKCGCGQPSRYNPKYPYKSIKYKKYYKVLPEHKVKKIKPKIERMGYTLEDIKKMYKEYGSMLKMVDRLGICYQTIWKYMHKNNIPIRRGRKYDIK